jgi:hypothetical protein
VPTKKSAKAHGSNPSRGLPGFWIQKDVAAGLGFEPRRAAPKTAVLPLDDPATRHTIIAGGGLRRLEAGIAPPSRRAGA